MKEKTLLEKVKEIRISRKRLVVTDEMSEIAIFWLNNEITIYQISEVLKCTTPNATYRMADILKEAHARGKLKEAL